jgi:O-antigen/teichoic acid export membrane protein
MSGHGSTGGDRPLHVLFSAAGVLLVLRGVGLVLQVLVFLLITRLLPIEAVGVYAVVNTGWYIAKGLGSLGLGQASLRFIPHFLANDKKGFAAQLEKVTRRIVATIAIATAAVTLVAGLSAKGLGVVDLQVGVLVAAALGVPAYVLILLLSNQLRARNFVFWSVFPEAVVLHSTQVVAMGVVWYLDAVTLEVVLFAQVFAAWVVLGTYLVVDRTNRLGAPVALPLAEWRQIRRVARGIFMTTVVTLLANRSPLFIVSAILGAPAAAILETANRFGQLPNLATWAVGAGVSPMLSAAHGRGDRGKLQDLFTFGSWLAFAPVMLYLALLTIFGPWLIATLFGADYAEAYVPMLLVCTSTVITASAGMATFLYFMTGYEQTAFVFSLAKLVIQIGASVGLGLFYGVSGVAAAMLIGSIVRDIGMSTLLGRHLNMHAGVWSWAGVRSVGRIFRQFRQGPSPFLAKPD